MALEDIESTGKVISDLNKNNPVGSTDAKNQGDNHIRGIKNVLLNTFPNVNAPVTLTDEELNQGLFPTGTKMVFFQAAAPANWTQDTSAAADNKMLRIVNSAGGGSGGTDSPITHVHTTGDHILTEAEMPSHTHTENRGAFQGSVVANGSGANVVTNQIVSTGSTGGDTAHNHGNTGSYAPKYVDMILCTKD